MYFWLKHLTSEIKCFASLYMKFTFLSLKRPCLWFLRFHKISFSTSKNRALHVFFSCLHFRRSVQKKSVSLAYFLPLSNTSHPFYFMSTFSRSSNFHIINFNLKKKIPTKNRHTHFSMSHRF